MAHGAARMEHDTPGHLEAVVGLLAVHPEALVEAALREELLAPDHHQRPGGRSDVDGLRRRLLAR
jgi:hypothetical protein